jgi:hypothetical protein
MSAMGHYRTSASGPGMSALPPKADMARREFANQIANQLCDTFLYQPSPARMIGIEIANRNARLVTARHGPCSTHLGKLEPPATWPSCQTCLSERL